MPVLTVQADDAVSEGEVRAALEHMAASEAFRGSPQLITFLRYVVEATLGGHADRIKGYTIATEALGRTVDFDPQADPIVRVEATRLRRALKRYYASVTGAEAVRIELPLGSYVPAFHRQPANVVLPLPAAAPPASQAVRRGLVPARLNWRHAIAGLALILLGAGSYAVLDFQFDFNTPNGSLAHASPPPSRPAAKAVRTATAFPVVFIGQFEASGGADAQAAADSLRAKLRDALARFDELNVVGDAAPDDERTRAAAAGSPSYYGLTASVATGPAGGLSATIRLTDIADNRVPFVRTFERTRSDDGSGPAEEAIVREVATALAQPYGFIHSRERIRLMSMDGNPHYRCLLESYEYWRTYEPAQHAHARECLETAISEEPGFAAGYTSLSEIILQEYRRNLNLRPGDAPPLDRALAAARRAVELRPGSARAYQALMDVYFLRGEYVLTLAAGEKAIALNPYNPNILSCYGARLVALGEVEKGARVLKEAAADIVVRPPWIDFFLFLAAYMMDDTEGAATYAGQITTDKFAIGFAARALAAAQRGDADQARKLLDKMSAMHPGWRIDLHGELKRLFPADAVADRLARDLTKAGLTATN